MKHIIGNGCAICGQLVGFSFRMHDIPLFCFWCSVAILRLKRHFGADIKLDCEGLAEYKKYTYNLSRGEMNSIAAVHLFINDNPINLPTDKLHLDISLDP